eukprot:1236509-Prymnesium_polylepis.1
MARLPHTRFQPSLSRAAVDALLAARLLGSPRFLRQAHAAFDALVALGSSRPFIARLAGAALCAFCGHAPHSAIPWASRLQSLA